MRDNIILAGVMGLDLSDINKAVFLEDATSGIHNVEAFIEFCRDKKDSIEYSTKTEKLDTLATMFKKLESDILLPHDTAKTFSHALAVKVDSARTFLKNELEVGNDKPFSRLRVEGDRYFTGKELNALSELGTARYIVLLAEENELESKLVALFLNKFRSKAKYKSLTDNQKRVHTLTMNKG